MNIRDKDVLMLIGRKIVEGDDFYAALSFYSVSKTTMQICENLPRWIKYKKIREILQSMGTSKNVYKGFMRGEECVIDYILYRGLEGNDPYLIYNATTGKGHIIRGSFAVYINLDHFRKNLKNYGDFAMISDLSNINFKNKKTFLSLTENAMNGRIYIVAKETRDEAISECVKLCARYYSQYAEYEIESLRKELEVGPCAYYSLSTLRIIEVDIDV